MMKNHKNTGIRRDQRRGATALLNVVLFGVLFSFALFSINIANIQKHRVSSQVSTDMAARFCTSMLAHDASEEDIEKIAKDIANVSYRGAIDEPGVEIALGSAVGVGDRFVFTPGATPTNAVRVTEGHSIPAYGPGVVTFPINSKSTSAAIDRDVCLVMDRSGSMNWIDDAWATRAAHQVDENPLFNMPSSQWYKNVPGSFNYGSDWYRHAWFWYHPHPTDSRWAEMIPALYGLADELDATEQQERLSIVSFSTTGAASHFTNEATPKYKRWNFDAASIEVQPTENYNAAAQQFENAYQTDKLVAGGTDIGAGIDLAAQLLNDTARDHAFKTIIVMTDGQQNSGRMPWEASADAAELDIQVHTVTFGVGADQAAMETTAEDGNGIHLHATDGESLEEVFRELARIRPNVKID